MKDRGVTHRLCSLTDAANMLGYSRTKALRLARDGALPVVGKLSGETGSYVLDLDAVEALAASRKKASA